MPPNTDTRSSHQASVNHTELLPSILDRLLDDQPEARAEPRGYESAVLRTIKRGICRDVQNLLNARRPLNELPPGCQELTASLVNYGLPDLQSLEIREAHELESLCAMIADVLRTFESRLHHVRVTPAHHQEGRQPLDRRLRFTIEALLVVDALEEPVLLSSAVDPAEGGFLVESIG